MSHEMCYGLNLTDFRSYVETDESNFCMKCLDTVFLSKFITDDELAIIYNFNKR